MTSALRRGAAAASVLVATSAGLTACGGGDDASEPSADASASTSASTSVSPSGSASASESASADESASASASGGVAPATGEEVDLDGILTARAPEGAELIPGGVSTTYDLDGLQISFFTLPTPLTGNLDDIAKAALETNSTPPVPKRGPDRTLGGIPGVTLSGQSGSYESFYLWAGGVGQNFVSITFSAFTKVPDFDQVVESVLATVQAG